MKFTFKSFSGDKNASQDPSPNDLRNPQAKRKDQVRRAQKTHRERKEAYTKSLEAEVVQLRANEAKIAQETRNLYAEITVLKKLLVQHNIPLPATTQQLRSESDSPEQRTFEFSINQDAKSKHRRRRIYVQRQAHHHHQYTSDLTDGENVENTNISYFSDPLSSSSISPPLTGLADLAMIDSPTKKLGDLDHAAIGIEFVLTLESPCLEHVIPEQSSSAATGHSLMATATLLHHHPSPPEQRLGPGQPPWQVSAIGVERLLQLSSDIPLSDGELTPVQAWDQLRKHPDFHSLEVARLERLKESLLKHVKCYGFGGVIEQGLFDNAVFEAFVVGRVF